MLVNRKTSYFIFLVVIFLALVPASAFAQPRLGEIYSEAKTRKGKRPIIIIPGILGSDLVNIETGKVVWFDVSRSKDDELVLPYSPNLRENRDKLISRDIIRTVKVSLLPELNVYADIIDSLKNNGGYTEASWDNPPDKLEDTFFVFPYDWRRDNVESAQILIQKIEALKKKMRRPDIKFNVIAHSMGGLVARYAAMYGDQDIPAGSGSPQLNWAGEKHFSRLFLFGTPNEGAFSALKTLLKGPDIFGDTNIPFVRNLTPADVFTMPSLFELMPHGKTAVFYDENLAPIDINLFSIETWKKYKWSIYGDKNFFKDLPEEKVAQVDEYFTSVLKRAKKFDEAINAQNAKKSSIGFFAFGSDCVPTLNSFVVYKDAKSGEWETLVAPRTFKNSLGKKVDSKLVEEKMFSPGDGRVTRRSFLIQSLLNEQKNVGLFDSAMPLSYSLFVCEEHDQLTNNDVIQNNFFSVVLNEGIQ